VLGIDSATSMTTARCLIAALRGGAIAPVALNTTCVFGHEPASNHLAPIQGQPTVILRLVVLSLVTVVFVSVLRTMVAASNIGVKTLNAFGAAAP
jgi:hypothetical protein